METANLRWVQSSSWQKNTCSVPVWCLAIGKHCRCVPMDKISLEVGLWTIWDPKPKFKTRNSVRAFNSQDQAVHFHCWGHPSFADVLFLRCYLVALAYVCYFGMTLSSMQPSVSSALEQYYNMYFGSSSSRMALSLKMDFERVMFLKQWIIVNSHETFHIKTDDWYCIFC